jgi:DNA-binding PadR family transcriptional regulator
MNDLIILALLLPGPKHGYQIKREAGWIIGQEAMHNNLVYPLLRRFLEEGWVTKKSVAGERGQNRQQYALTARGRQALLARLSTYNESDARSVEGFNMRVGLFELLKPEVREHILSLREKYLRSQVETMAALQSHMDVGSFGGEVLRHRHETMQLELNWIRRLRRLVKSNSEDGGNREK